MGEKFLSQVKSCEPRGKLQSLKLKKQIIGMQWDKWNIYNFTLNRSGNDSCFYYISMLSFNLQPNAIIKFSGFKFLTTLLMYPHTIVADGTEKWVVLKCSRTLLSNERSRLYLLLNLLNCK
jgi:hypothetical protein